MMLSAKSPVRCRSGNFSKGKYKVTKGYNFRRKGCNNIIQKGTLVICGIEEVGAGAYVLCPPHSPQVHPC